jgi:hypothetical protein
MTIFEALSQLGEMSKVTRDPSLCNSHKGGSLIDSTLDHFNPRQKDVVVMYL